MTCNVVGIAQYHILKSKIVAMCFALCQNLNHFLDNLPLKMFKTELKRF